MLLKTKLSVNPLIGLLAVMAVLVTNAPIAFADDALFTSVTDLSAPVADGAREPSLSTMIDGRVLMSWTEPQGQGFAVKVAIFDGSGWSKPQTVVERDDLFVNWADFPSAIALADGTLVAHWLQINGDASYQYDVRIARSDDEGKTWSKSFVPHDDRSQREHGFVTLLPTQSDDFMAIWLDGRNYDIYASQEIEENAMQLRARSITGNWEMSDDALIDARTCTCCQTSAVVADNGDIVAVYRDRSLEEIRDISIVRYTPQGWSAPTPVSPDGWHIEGCPVNGPAIDADDGQTVVAWFTAANDVPKVKVAFSSDDGVTFGKAFEIDNGAPSGRVDVIQQAKGSALVTWVEQTAQGEVVLICAVDPKAGCEHPRVVAVSSVGRTVGFPRMALGEQGVFIAWTEPSQEATTHPEGGTTIRTILARTGEVK
uniref:sialidase family protein n=1 Tax=Pararhizobium sp. IMCC3301 TaxID=3067904 RepID=UPI002740EA65|nr:sialidase family protein [Pararhizobium sp. IMCC3301]